MNMMNKYSLKFKYLALENQYLLQRQTNITAPLFQAASFCIFVVSTYRLILLIMEKKLDKLPILIACSLFTFVSLVLFQFRIHKVNLQIIILAYLLLGYEILITSDTSFESYDLYVSNFTCCSIIIMLMLEFTDSMFVFITCNTFKLIYTIIIDSRRSYTTYVSTVLLTMFLCYFSHKINIQSRMSFLLSQQEYIWESIFPKIIEKPYIILSFNEDRIEFSYKSSQNLFFQCINNVQLKEFLREWKYQQKSLEVLLYQFYQDSKQADLKTSFLEVQNEKKEKLKIKFAIFLATSSIFLSIEKQQQRSELSVSVQRIQSQYQKLFVNQLEKIQKAITTSLKQKQFLKLYQLRNKFFSQVINFQIRTQVMKIVEFDSLLLIQIQELFEQKGLKIIFEQNDEINNKIFFPQNYFQRLLFEICKVAFKNTQIQIKFGNVFLISYLGNKIIFGKNPNILKVWHAIVESYKINKNFKQILLYKEASVKFGSI